MTQQSATFLPAIEKLIGRENYNTWSFAVKTYLEHESLWDYVNPDANPTPESDDESIRAEASKDLKAKTKIILLIHPSNYHHVQNCGTAKAVWQSLKSAFEDSGLMRKVGLIRTLTSTKLQNCSSMEDYVTKIMTAAHRLRDIHAEVSDDWLAAFLLAGLTDQFTPFIMALEGSGKNITADAVKTKLLQEVKPSTNVPQAFYSSKKQRKSQSTKYRASTPSAGMSNIRCYNCNQYGHMSKTCPKKKQAPTSFQDDHCLQPSQPKGLIAAFSTFYDDSNDWFFDSASSFHMTMREDWLNDNHPSTVKKITIADKSFMEVKSAGLVTIPVVCENTVKQLPVSEVLHVPDLSVNLLSISQIVSKGNTVIFDNSGCKVLDENSDVIVTGEHVNNMFKLRKTCLSESQCFVSKDGTTTRDIWHQRMAHLNMQDLSKLKNHLATGISFSDSRDKTVCVPCTKGKHSRQQFPKEGSRATSILDLIHSDLCGPMEVHSFNGAKYFLTLIDDLSRKVFVYFLKTKEHVQEIFHNFKIMYEKQVSKVIRKLRSDNGGEYISSELEEYLKQCGIIHQTSAPNTPEQNGLAERMNRTIVERARSVLIAAGLPKVFWAEAVATVAYLINRSPTRGHGKTPEEVWTGVQPDLSHLRVFGCKALMHVPKKFRKKWDPKSTEMIFVGYCENTKGYRLIHPTTRRLTISRDVVFIENQFIRNVCSTEEMHQSVGDVFPYFDSELDFETQSIQIDETNELDTEEQNQFQDINAPNDVEPNAISLPTLRRSERVPRPKVFPDFVSYCVQGFIPEDPMTVEEALSSVNSKDWKAAMTEEFNSLQENNTWQLTELPPNRRPIQCKWVFKTKRDSDGRVIRYKARLVAKGFTQQQGIDYGETFSPVVRYTSIRMLLAISAQFNLDIEQMDVVTAFLHGKIDEDIYMVQPPEFAHDDRVCKLNKALYGLKQSSRQWYLELDSNLTRNGFQKSLVDPCVYFDINLPKMTFVAVFIDDLLIFSNDNVKKTFLKAKLRERFKMTDLGEAKFCVGLRINRDRQKGIIFIDQKRHIADLLLKFNMVDCNPVTTPMDSNQKLSKNMSPQSSSEREEMSSIPYRELVGGLVYISQGTRPDISFAVNALSIFNDNPGRAHWTAAKRVLRYLKATIDAKLQYSMEGRTDFTAFCDADWASNIDDRRSCSGYVFMKQGGAISWSSRRQPTIALSTTEAEYMALSSTVQESAWLDQFQSQFNFGGQQPIQVYCDNTSALDLAKTTGYSARTKHIDVRHHYLREHIESGRINLVHIPTNVMVADVLTKPLNQVKHLFCSEGMGLIFLNF